MAPDGKTVLEKRSRKGIWQNLYQFPLVESDKTLTMAHLKKEIGRMEWPSSLNISSVVAYNDEPITHKLSHQHLKIRFWIIQVDKSNEGFIGIEALHEKPVPIILANFISHFPFLQL